MFQEGKKEINSILEKTCILSDECKQLFVENIGNPDGLRVIWEYGYNNPEEASTTIAQFLICGDPAKAQKLAQLYFNDGGSPIYLDLNSTKILLDRTRAMYHRFGDTDIGSSYTIVAAVVQTFVNATYQRDYLSDFTQDNEFTLGRIMDKYKDLFIQALFEPINNPSKKSSTGS